MPLTDLDVANLGITKAGGRAIGSFDENTPLAELAARRYPHRREEMLSRHRWTFAKSVVQLARIATPTGCPLTYAYARPAGLVGNIWDYRIDAARDALKADCLQLADYIASEDAAVWVEFTGSPAEARWPRPFVELVACVFAIDVANARLKASQARDLTIEAFGNPEDAQDGGLLLVAKQADGVDAPKRTLGYEGGGPLVAVRGGGCSPFDDPRWQGPD
jgi:hypothetical protein